MLGTKPNKVGIEGRVLIIDDDVDFQFMVGTMLRSSGYSVKSLLEGKLPTTLTLARDCDVILLDIELPGMSGVDLGKLNDAIVKVYPFVIPRFQIHGKMVV